MNSWKHLNGRENSEEMKKMIGKKKTTVLLRKRKNGKERERGNIWNPVNLQREVHAFGYNFKWTTYLMTVFLVIFLLGAVGVFYKLKFGLFVLTLAVMFAFVPVFIIDMYRRMYEQRRFADVTDYMEQVLYAFRKERRVLGALRECYGAMPDGMMRRTVAEAIAYIEQGEAKTEQGVTYEALEKIEKAYECSKLHMVHELLIHTEERGGDAESSIVLLLEDLECWKRSVYGLQGNKKKSHMDNIMSIIMAVLVCGIDMYVMDMVKEMAGKGTEIGIFEMPAVQISSFVFLIACIFIFYMSTKKLVKDWLQRDTSDEKAVLNSYTYLKKYDEKRETKRSLLFALPLFAAALLCYLWLPPAVSVICILLGVFLLMQHRFSYRMYMRDVQNALYLAFPEWMMDIALLLQTNNVQVAIAKSAQRAEPILQEELRQLGERIAENPGDVKSYTDFCALFQIPEITSCMKMLYSISESGSGDAERQISNLIGQVHKLQEKQTEVKNESIAFSMRMIFFYPVAATSVKLLIDMTAGMLLIFQLFGQLAG